MSIRVLAISEHYLPRTAGTSTYVDCVCSGLARSGVEVTLMTPEQPERNAGARSARFEGECIRVPVREFSDPELFRHRLNVAIAQRAPDIVHVMHGHYVYRALQRGGVPLVWTCHNVPPEEYPPFVGEQVPFHWFVNAAYRKAVRVKHRRLIRRSPYDVVIADCNAVRDILVHDVGVPQERIEVVPIGIDVMTGGAIGPEAIPEPGKSPILMTLGAIKSHKNIHLIPGIVKRLAESGIRPEWHIVGRSENREYASHVNHLIRASGVEQYIFNRSELTESDLEDLWRRCNLYVHLSSAEGYGLAVLESLAHGVPVVGTNVGAIPELLRDCRGVVVEPTAESIYQGIAWAASNWDYFPYRDHLKRLVATHYSWERTASLTCQVYQSILNSTLAMRDGDAS